MMLRRTRQIAIVMAVGILATIGSAQAACTLSLGWESYEPFQFKDAAGAVTGLDVEIFQEVAKTIGCTVTTKEIPWKRLVDDLEAGRMDAAMGLQSTPEREAIGAFSPAYRRDDMVLVVRKGELAKVGDKGLGSLPGRAFRLGTSSGYEYGELFDSLKKDPAFAKQIDEAPSTELNLRKLVGKRIDGLIENGFVVTAMARKEGVADSVEAHPVPVLSADALFMFSRKSVDPKTVAAFTESLNSLKANGRIDAIIAKYLK